MFLFIYEFLIKTIISLYILLLNYDIKEKAILKVILL